LYHEPDWEALNEINFLLYNRVADGLNAALSAIAIAQMPDDTDQPAEWWYQRARAKIEGILNLIMSWSWLIQFKGGSDLPEKVIRPFQLQTMLDWVSLHLQLVPPLAIREDIVVQANQQTVQEALILLYSAASTQGAGVTIFLDHVDDGVQFRIRFARLRPVRPWQSIDELIAQQGSHWRQQAVAFELATARDFLLMNQIPLGLSDAGTVGEFSFSLYKPGKRPTGTTESPSSLHHKQAVAHIAGVAATQPAQRPSVVTGTTEAAPESFGQRRYEEQQWHLPAVHLRANSRLFKSSSGRIPHPIPDQPPRPGGWHRPTLPSEGSAGEGIREQQLAATPAAPIIISLDLPEPTLPREFRNLDLARETHNLQRLEADDKPNREAETRNDDSLTTTAQEQHEKEQP
jgi:hypothetical protein